VLLTSLVVVTAVTAVLCMLAVVHGLSRELLRLSALAILGIVAWKMIDPPGDELRRGALVAAASALVLVASALAVASAPLKRRRGPRFGHPGVYVPPPAPPRWDPNDSVGPPR
jgi:alkylhydroperoxidase family enzyme